MDRLNDILSNSQNLPSRQPASDKRAIPNYRLPQQRPQITRRTLVEQQRKQNQSPTLGQDAAAQPMPPQSQPQRQTQNLASQRARQQFNYRQTANEPDGRREPITRIDYPTYPVQPMHPMQPDSGMEAGTLYQGQQPLRTQPHQELPHLQPLQPRPTNDYYTSRPDSDDYTSPLHADVVEEDGWEGGMIYADFEQDSNDAILYEDEEVEDLEDEQPGYLPPHQISQLLPPQASQQLPPALPSQQPRYQHTQSLPPAQAQRYQTQAYSQRQERQERQERQDAEQTQQPRRTNQNHQNMQNTQNLQNSQLPRLSNLHDTRLASALARQRASRQNPYQRVTQPLDVNMATRAASSAAMQPTEQPLQPRLTRIQPSQRVRSLPAAVNPETLEEELPQSRHVSRVPIRERSNRGERTATLPEPNEGSLPAPRKLCPKCKGAGYLRSNVPFGHPNFGKPIACECKEEERKEKRRQQLRTLSNLDAFRDRNFADFQVNVTIAEGFNAACNFADDPYGWLVLVGPNGCGKTHLAAAIANQCVDQGAVVLFEAVPDLLDHLRAAFAPTAEEVYDQLFSKMREAELLVLDDLGAQQSTAWANEKLFQLLNYRYNREMPTVVTANQKGIQAIDERIRSRLGDMSLVNYITMDKARDFRPVRGKQQ
ncbi:hypothetical protein ccbrp13_40840 [Ktedonobacteria bacterium brp13]|nr:hypothetical protein ccbrp13_40840 [Ktedonobacteria bacterium brp13]